MPNYRKGFTLIESLIGVAIFSMLSLVVYQSLVSMFKEAQANWDSTTVSSLASQFLENARNIPYSQIGTLQGNPHGSLPDQPNASSVTVGTTTYQAYFEVTYMDDPADGTFVNNTDVAPDDYKQVKLSIKNTSTNKVTNYVTTIVPTGLEGMTSGGALSISVIDAVGQPVPNASINIVNNSINPSINLTRTSDANGHWIEVGLPNSSNSYQITASKSGYSTDQTYPSSVQNPNPVKPDATIADGQVTQVSFSIDKTSNLTFNTLDQTCSAIPNVSVGIQGAKLIGTPNVLKYNNSFSSNSSGQITLNNIEWDDYTPAIGGNTYMIYGSSPIQRINLLPNTTQSFNLILGSKTTDSLLVIVKDSSTGNPIEGASVTLTKTSPSINTSAITGGSLWSQEVWNGGSGQANWSNNSKYWNDDGGISTNDTPLAMRLINDGTNTLVDNAVLESSTFDTGGTSSFTTLDWQPESQDPATSVKFQIATNNDNTTWNFKGPDGTSNTYYTNPSTNINSPDNRYIRYKAFLTTNDPTKNPTITSVNINYVSGCFTPGQVIFPNLASGSDYQIDVSMSGYADKTVSNLNISGYQTLQVLLTPN